MNLLDKEKLVVLLNALSFVVNDCKLGRYANEHCKEKNKLYFGIGKVYDDPIISVDMEIESDTMVVTKETDGNYIVDTYLLLWQVRESTPDVAGYTAFPSTFVFADTAEGCKIVSVTSHDDCDRVLAHTTADEQLQRLREEWENRP